MTDDLTLYRTFGVAIAIGLLVGIERYKSRSEHDRQSAGVRTFTVIALLGAVSALLGSTTFTALIFSALMVFLSLGYWSEAEHSVGLTTELAALLTFWLGFLVSSHEVLAVGTSIVLVELLAHKKSLHTFVRGILSEVELYDTLKFLLVVFVVYPLLPDTYLTRYEFIRPTQIWLLVIVVSSISYFGYVLVRVLGSTRGLLLNALVGGLVSTTAVTVSLAERSRAAPPMTRLFGVTAVMANAVQGPRLLVLILVVDPALAATLAGPLIAFGLAGIAGALSLARVKQVWAEEPPAEVLLQNPYSFLPALKFALLLSAVLVVSKAAQLGLGEQALFAVAATAGLADASAISLSIADLFNTAAISAHVAGLSVLLAVSTNAAVKLILAWRGAGRDFAFWVGGGFVTMLAAAWGLFLLQPAWWQ